MLLGNHHGALLVAVAACPGAVLVCSAAYPSSLSSLLGRRKKRRRTTSPMRFLWQHSGTRRVSFHTKRSWFAFSMLALFIQLERTERRRQQLMMRIRCEILEHTLHHSFSFRRWQSYIPSKTKSFPPSIQSVVVTIISFRYHF
jgi:hypothetical protein